ncbi:MAG: pseudouridine synthase [Candidatus Omnitrophota bacterium]|nr:pseudouridine synthase [Candidatus Omnitrophota bacterium]
MQRIQKILSNYGFCSRRKAEELIKERKVKVNDRIASIGDKASENDKIYVDRKLVREQKKVYLMINKPVACVTALKDGYFKTVMDYVRIKERVFPVGRLDCNTSGLLLLTNDGDFANKITHPRYEIEKIYFVEIDRPIAEKEIRLIEKGINLKDGRTSPAKIKRFKKNQLEIAIHEGRNRIVRRIFKKLNFKVKALHRVSIGKLSIGDLKPGKYRFLLKKDREEIFKRKKDALTFNRTSRLSKNGASTAITENGKGYHRRKKIA